MKVERPRERLSEAPMRVKTRSITAGCGIGRDERPHLRQDGDERGLAQVGGFAAHVGAGDDGDQVGGIVEIQIVGDEAAGVLIGQALDDGVASG